MMTKNKVDKQFTLIENIRNFHKRWNIEITEKDSWDKFKHRFLNSYSAILGSDFLYNAECDEEFSTLIGIHSQLTKTDKLSISITGKDFEDCFSYNYFWEETDIKKIIFGIEAISWMSKISKEKKQNFFSDIRNIIDITNVPLVLKQVEHHILFYPAGARLLDEKLVNDNLDWLIDSPTIYETFKKGLSELGIKGKERHAIDNFRLSIELLLKEKLGNSKSIENQKADLGKYLKSKNISTEISNIYWLNLDYYSKYHNNNVKHSDKVNPNEVEFILYITGVLMRLLLNN